MRAELRDVVLYIDGSVVTLDVSVGEYSKALKQCRNSIIAMAKTTRVYVLFLGNNNWRIFTPEGRNFLKNSKFNYKLLEKQHFVGKIYPYWEAIEKIGFQPVLSNASLSQVGFFLSVNL